jgi:hypothetical protein
MHRQTLGLKEEVLGQEHPSMLDSMNNLTVVLFCPIRISSHTSYGPSYICMGQTGHPIYPTTLCNYRGISIRFIDTIDNVQYSARTVLFNENPFHPY